MVEGLRRQDMAKLAIIIGFLICITAALILAFSSKSEESDS